METISIKHKGPHLGMVSIIFAILFITGLSFVITFTANAPHYPGPWESAQTIAHYFQNHSGKVLLCAFFQFGSAIPLGIYTATAYSRLRFMGIDASGTTIALFGGLMMTFNVAISALLLWVMSYPGIASETVLNQAIYNMVFAIGGVGYSVPLGLLIAGITITSFFNKLLPKWLLWFGIVLSVCGVISWLSLIFPNLLFLIPLTRFPGFIWLIVAGFLLPSVNVVSKSK